MIKKEDLRNIVVVSHNLSGHDKAVSASIYNLFFHEQAPLTPKGYLYAKGSRDHFWQQVESCDSEETIYLFNGLTCLCFENSIRLLLHCTLNSRKVIIYWHESAWNQRFLQRKHAIQFNDVRILLHNENVIHFVTNEKIRELILFQYGCPLSNIRVVYECIHAPGSPLPEYQNFAEDVMPIRIVAAGVPVLRKGVDLYAKLSSELKIIQTRPIVYEWFAATPDHTENVEIQFHDSVIWKGHSQEFLGDLANADVFVMPSRDDPFPLVCLEALSLGIPVFCFDTIGTAEALPDEFVASSVADMREKIEKYLCGKRMAREYFVEIARNYTPDRFVSRVLDGFSAQDIKFPDSINENLHELYIGKIREIDQLKRDGLVVADDGMEHKQARIEVKALTREINQIEARKVAPNESKVGNKASSKIDLNTKVQNGRVLIIGNSPMVLECQLGKIINEFDIVIRINNYKIKGYENHVGTKTDFVVISYACEPNLELSKLSKRQRLLYTANLYDSMEQMKARMLSTSSTSMGVGIPPKDMVRLSPTLYYYGLKRLIKLGESEWATTGTVAVQWAMDNFGLSHEVFVHGFSFYSESRGDALDHYFGTKTVSDGAHSFPREARYLLSLERQGRIRRLVNVPGPR
ncbi:MAG: glycosyltransferase family 29 protein [Luteolibacter sp.]